MQIGEISVFYPKPSVFDKELKFFISRLIAFGFNYEYHGKRFTYNQWTVSGRELEASLSYER
jgi:hypothetical protein